MSADARVSRLINREAAARDAAIETHRTDTTDVHGIADTSQLATLDDLVGLGGGGGGGAPSGPAGGVLAGTYPNPAFAVAMATQAALTTETSARSSADTAEASTRAAADTANAAAAAAAQATANAALPKAGGTMTGAIVLVGDPTANLHPATRQYVAAQIAALINSAPGALDTLGEIAAQLSTDESAVSALTATVAGKLAAASNLSDLVNAVTARTNLGLGSAATHPATDFDAVGAAAAAQAASQPLDADLTAIAALTTTAFGRGLLTQADAAAVLAAIGAVASTDARLTDARTPTAHHATHEPGGSDAMAVDAAAATGSLRTLGTGAQQATAGNDARLSDQRTPVDGTVTDAKITAGGLSPSKVTGTAVITSDSRLSDARTPTAHKATHATGGSDALAPADIGAQAASARLAEIAALNTNATVPEQVGGVWVARSMAALKTDLALTKGDVGLGSVDNTADTAKPVSTAQQTALDLKANLASPTLTGDPKAPTPSVGDNDTSIATTAFVNANAVLATNRPTAVLAADVGPISSQATLQNITGLGLAIGASATEIWRLSFWLLVDAANGTMGAKVGFTVPAGCTMKWGALNNSALGGWGMVPAGSTPATLLTESGTQSFGTLTGVSGVALTCIVFGGGTSGTVQVQYAQNSSNAGNLKIDKGSLMEAVKVA